MTVDWSTVLVPAGVSLAVALAAEYAAKPALEARKERILATHAARRYCISLIERAGIDVMAINSLRGTTPDRPEMAIVLRAELSRLREDIDQVSKDLIPAIAQLPPLPRDVTFMINVVSSYLRGIGMSTIAVERHDMGPIVDYVRLTAAAIATPTRSPIGWVRRKWLWKEFVALDPTVLDDIAAERR